MTKESGPRPPFSRGRPCADFAEQRSALVDGALADDDRERLLRHLVDCADCRDEVESLHRIRDLLRRSAAGSGQSSMADRLISIAGDDAGVPLWSRPFDRPSDPRPPPSHRGARRRRLIGTGVVLLALSVSAIGAGWMAAPQAEAVIDNPAAGSAAEFSATLAQMPLASHEVTAVLATDLTSLPRSRAEPAMPAAPAHPVQLTVAEAAAVLDRAVQANGQVNHRGEAKVTLGQRGQRIVVDVDVVAQAGQGTQLTVRGANATVLNQGFLPLDSTSTRMPSNAGSSDLVSGLSLTGTSGASVAGRAATQVTAAGAGGAQRSWWIDDRTGLLLWQSSSDSAGEVISSAGFTSVTTSAQPFLAHLAPRLTVPLTTSSLTLGSAPSLARTGWFCPGRLDGLELVRLRTDTQQTSDPAAAPGVVQTVYTDGVSVISVMQQRGRLAEELPGFRDTGGVWLRDTGGLRVAAWQSGDMVITAITDGTADLLTHSLAQLPPVEHPADSKIDRVRAGWARIHHLVMG